MRVLISGASGFIGASLSLLFRKKGYELFFLTRKKRSLSPSEISWDALENLPPSLDAIIHLAGEPLTLFPWSQKKKEKILQSRVKSTQDLCKAALHQKSLPRVWISASAVGFYGNRGETALTEESEVGRGFLPQVCSALEGASSSLKGVRRVFTRFGVVLGGGGGVLKQLTPIYRMGLGATLGSGEQWLSWIHIFDLVRAIDEMLQNEALEGPVNCVSPHPVRQKEFSHLLAHVLHRPHFLKVPSFFLKLLLRDVADEMLLCSAKVLPKKLCDQGFHFEAAELKQAFEREFSIYRNHS